MASKKEVLKSLIVRPPSWNPNKLHPDAKKKMDIMTQPLEPLLFKLQDLTKEQEINKFNPIGVKEILPFYVKRTSTGNLPVYKEYRNQRNTKRTVVRLVEGDVEAFSKELSKIVSNHEIIQKVGAIYVKGIHKESISLWLRKLGF